LIVSSPVEKYSMIKNFPYPLHWKNEETEGFKVTILGGATAQVGEIFQEKLP
jgi:hypothetical protein